MKNNLKKGLVSAALAGSMMVALPGAAFAADVASSDDGASTPITKNWTVASATQFDANEVFDFTLTYDHAVAIGTNETAAPTGNATGVQIKAADMTANDLTYTAQKTLADALSGVHFSKPGQYYFNLNETGGSNPNIVYSTVEYQVRVDVVWSDDLATAKIQKVQLLNSDATAKAKDAVFANDAKANDTLKVSKTVSGVAANTADEFTYTLTLDGVQGSYNFVKSDGTSGTIKSGDTFTLKHGQTIEIKNLPEGATYKVVETDTAYDESVTVNGTAQADGHVAEGTIASANNVSYLNEKGFASNTGITANSLPFVALAVVAAAGGATLIISRKRRASEEF